VQGPTNRVANEGSTVSFSVSAGGTPTLLFQWFFNSNLIASATNATATNATLTLTNITTTNAGFYQVVVSNSFGTVTSTNARLTVTITNGAPIIAQQPQSQTVSNGSTVTFSVVASGAQPFTYQWLFNLFAMDPAITPSATNATLILSNVITADSGFYEVIVSNIFGSVRSAAATLTVTNAPGSSNTLAGARFNVATELGLGSVKLTEHGIEIPVTGTRADQSLVLEFKEALTESKWTPLSTNRGPVTLLIDPTLPPRPARFYRIREE
jgi:hypothetical protein